MGCRVLMNSPCYLFHRETWAYSSVTSQSPNNDTVSDVVNHDDAGDGKD